VDSLNIFSGYRHGIIAGLDLRWLSEIMKQMLFKAHVPSINQMLKKRRL